ncbi:MAG TPA: phosphoenolpyruvate--protein phosphotransferase [Pyrinomonadaceae bacterium]|nr:phosphoenolpyruvate--protein phosphotransferase [Pyrinomonadaceae bacterium]
MVERKLLVQGRLGLHARAAANLVRVASGFHSDIDLCKLDGGPTADAKSILSVLMLAASAGTAIIARASGDDEEAALSALENLFADNFGERENTATSFTESTEEIRCRGLGVSDGIVLGRVLRMQDGAHAISRWTIDEADLQRERQRFLKGAALAAQQLRKIRDQAQQRLGKEHAYIFDAHLMLLQDEKLIGSITEYIAAERVNAQWAVKVVGDRLAAQYATIKDEYLRERAADVEDVMQRLLLALGKPEAAELIIAEHSVIVSRDLLPSALAELDLGRATALVTDTGGWTSHTAILARGLGLPAVVGLKIFYQRANTGDKIIVDATHDQVILNPSDETLAAYREQTNTRRSKQVPTIESGSLRTKDGTEIRLRANVELPEEFGGVKEFGAKGIGLYRSEFLLARGGLAISEAEQRTAYEQVANVAGNDGAIIRLFDLGGETSRVHVREQEKNPALGLRAIRFGLRNDNIMRTQLRAILLAATKGNLKIVLPMVSDVSEIKRARKMLQEESAALTAAGNAVGDVELGAMIEVPAAVTIAEKIAAVSDFFELGTNDLVQYTLAVDRGNDEVADWFRTLHPAVLSGIDKSLKAARERTIPAIVCGEMASTPAYVVLLIGLGATDLSMTPAAMPRIRRVITEIDQESACSIVKKCLNCGSADEVENLVHHELASHWPTLFPPEALPQVHQLD